MKRDQSSIRPNSHESGYHKATASPDVGEVLRAFDRQREYELPPPSGDGSYGKMVTVGSGSRVDE